MQLHRQEIIALALTDLKIPFFSGWLLLLTEPKVQSLND